MKEKIKLFFKNKYAVVVSIIMLLLILPSVFYPLAKGALDAGLDENRELKKFPCFSDHYGRDLEEYYNDRLPFRSSFIKAYQSLYNLIVGKTQKGLESILPEEQIPIVKKNNVIYGKDGWMFYEGDASESYYLGTNKMTDAELAEYNSILMKTDEYFFKQNKKFAYMLISNKEQIHYENMPAAYKPVTEFKRADALVDYCKKNSGARIVYPKESLLAVKPEYQPYAKYDTHWNNLGAYIGYMQLLRSLNIEPVDIKDLVIEQVGINGGDLANMVMETSAEDTGYNITYKPHISVSSEMLGKCTKYTSDSPNPLSIAIIGDSFRMGMLQYLSKDFSTVIETHWSEIYNSVVKAQIESADIVIFQTVERYDAQIRLLNSFVGNV